MLILSDRAPNSGHLQDSRWYCEGDTLRRRRGGSTMKTVFRLVFLIAFIGANSSLIMAQWPAYPTPNVPKTADGKPNLEAPTPRTADGKPDLSGLWSRAGGGQRGAAGQAAAGQQGQRGQGPPAPPPLPPDGIPNATFGNAGQGFKDDLPFQP